VQEPVLAFFELLAGVTLGDSSTRLFFRDALAHCEQFQFGSQTEVGNTSGYPNFAFFWCLFRSAISSGTSGIVVRESWV
jgi:hypothetical protein